MTDISIKEEPMDEGLEPSDSSSQHSCHHGSSTGVRERINLLFECAPQGVTQTKLNTLFQTSNENERVEAAKIINELLSKNVISVSKIGGSREILFKLNAGESSSEFDGLTNIEKVILQTIQDSGNKGIWINTIRDTCQVPNTQMVKALKTLESKKKIKLVKSVADKKKKIYMMYELEPDQSITGGAWYNNDQEFDDKFAEILNNLCFKYLEETRKTAMQRFSEDPYQMKQASFTSSAKVLEHITRSNISKVPLQISDIEMVLETLYYDGKVEFVADPASSHRLWCSVNHIVTTTGLVQMPCGVCPVMSQCHIGGSISPQNCLYMKEWLKF